MNCGRVSNQLSAYLDRELTGMEMLQIRTHLGDCDRCCAEYEALGRMKTLLGRLRSVEPPSSFVLQSMRRCERTRGRPAIGSPWGSSRRGPAPFIRFCVHSLSFYKASGDWGGAPPAVRQVLGGISWQRLTLGLTTAALAAALIFTNVILRHHSDALVASTPPLVLQGRQDQLETPQFVEWPPGEPVPHDAYRGPLSDGQSSLPWVNVSLQGENSWSFR